eukprot:sb/3477431/
MITNKILRYRVSKQLLCIYTAHTHAHTTYQGVVPQDRNQEPTETSKQPIRSRYLGHVTGYQPIRDQYFLTRSVPDRYITVCSQVLGRLCVCVCVSATYLRRRYENGFF